MIKFFPRAFAPVLGAVFLLTLCPVAARAKNAEITKALKHDLKAIPAGTMSPTPEQKQALFDDLARLFQPTGSVPAATLDYVTAQLAQAKAEGIFFESDDGSIAQVLTFILNGSSRTNKSQLAALRFVLARAQVQPAHIDQLLTGLQALSKSFFYNSDSTTRSIGLPAIAADQKGYKHANGYASLSQTLGPLFNDRGVVTDAAHLFQDLTVSLSQAPLGRYHVLATTRANAQPVELGTLRVHPGSLPVNVLPITDAANVAAASSGESAEAATAETGKLNTTALLPPVIISPLPPVSLGRNGFVTFSNRTGGKEVPAGFDLADLVGITVTDDAGTAQFTGNFSGGADELISRSLNLHLDATAAAPTAAGTTSLTVFDNAGTYDRNFQFSATGFPANATLTLSADGAAVGPVLTEPTGKLFIKDKDSSFPKPRNAAETVNILPDTTDLSALKSFTLSDAQGNVLAKAGF